MKATLLVLNLGMQNTKVTKETIIVKNDLYPVLPIAAVLFDRLTDTRLSIMLLSHF